ncbi:MAG TPA: CotH kinase family protein [Bacteroidia bacterium]|nr:CotH kinase family protein [Bacteroidia bacterium]
MKKLYFLSAFLLSSFLHAQTYNGSTGPVNDVSVNDFTVNVSGLSPATIDTANFGLVSVTINLTHTWDADLDIQLISPDGTAALLSSGNGGSGDNYTGTVFIQGASQNIVTGSAPFTGSFVPQGQMGLVNNGQNGNGTWTLRVTDMASGDSGNMLGWSITFGNTPATYFAFHDSNLPIVVINTNNQTIVDNPKIMADMGIIYNGPGNRNHMTDPHNNYDGKIGIEIRGSSSQMFPKKSYGFETWDVNGNQIDSSLLGMPKENDWILCANYSDKSMLNNTLTYHLASEMGRYAVRHQHVELVINGEYMGVYVLMEKIKRDANRVDISKLKPTDISGDQLTGGYIIKIDKSTGNGGGGWISPFAPDTAPNGQTIFFQYEYPSDVNIVPQQEAYIQAYVDSFETALAGPNFADTATGYAHYIDVNSFVDYFLLNEMSRNVDGYRLSTFLYKNKYSKGGKLVIGPVWDYDIAWGNADYCSGNDSTGWAYQFGNVCSGDNWQVPFWWDRLMQDSVFRDRVKCRWAELSQTVLSVPSLHQYCDSMATYLNESQARNFIAWPILGTYVWPNPSPVPTTYQGEIDELENWIDARWTWLDNNMPGTMAGCNLASVPQNTTANDLPPAYPNPFSDAIHLSIYLPHAMPVQMELVNALGQTVQPVQTVQHTGGTQTITFTPDQDLPPGIYLLRITAGNVTWTQQLSRAE